MADSKENIETMDVNEEAEMKSTDKQPDIENTTNYDKHDNQNNQQSVSQVLHFVQNNKHISDVHDKSDIVNNSDLDIFSKKGLSPVNFSTKSNIEVLNNFSEDCENRNLGTVADNGIDTIEHTKIVSEEARNFVMSDSKVESICNEALADKDNQNTMSPVMKKITNLPDGYTDSSHSSSSDMQLPYQASDLPLEKFQSLPQKVPELMGEILEHVSKPVEESLPQVTETVEEPAPLVASDTMEESLPLEASESTEESLVHKVPEHEEGQVHISETGTTSLPQNVLDRAEESSEQTNSEPVQESLPQPVPEPPPIIVPTPRKRGRPRKQVLPLPSPLADSVGSIVPQPTPEATPSDYKRSTRSERRLTKRRKLEEEEKQKQPKEIDTPKRSKQSVKTPVQKRKTKKSTYVPKKRGQIKKKHSDVENFQNFEEETRMSASEGQSVGFSTKPGVTGDESQSSFTTDGHTKNNTNKKGRMEVMTDGCKPVTVQQIVEYHWPPPSAHGEKSEGLMIQEQITEYLGVKSFKRKYPSIKRRPVDMEERNYLQENGFVSENMCDMGLTAVFSADIIEIMYNDFPQKFEEYRKYAREKKAKEQRALREKQAAERADMDPQKEAVESAQNWNAEFNKTRRKSQRK